jgi:hypothetical protein
LSSSSAAKPVAVVVNRSSYLPTVIVAHRVMTTIDASQLLRREPPLIRAEFLQLADHHGLAFLGHEAPS